MATTRFSLLLAAILCTVMAASGTGAQEAPVLPQTLYGRAQRALLNGDFEAAYTDFSLYAEKYPASPAHGPALLGAAKAALHTDRFDVALQLGDRYLDEHPSATGRGMAQLYRGHALLASYALKQALAAYVGGYRAADEHGLRVALRTVVERLANEVDVETAEELFSADLPPDLAAGAWMRVGERLEAAGKRYRATNYFARIADRYPDEPAGIAARVRQRELEDLLAHTVRVGLLLPLSGHLAAYGEELKRGVTLAADEFSDSTGREIELITEDTEGNAVVATRKCQQLMQREPVAVIGPLTSASAIGCAATTAAHKIPLLVPAATETGLSTLGDAVFCLSPSAQQYGGTLGRYAVERLGLCSHLIIAPNDEYGHDIAAAYREAVEATGGEIWHETFYEPGVTDFGPYLRAFKSSFLDTLSDTTWFYAPDSTELEYEEITVYPDAVFTPGYAQDMLLLVPQIRFYKIAGRILGTDSFGDGDVLNRVGNYLEDAVFSSVQPLADGMLAWQLFSSRYARTYGGAPERMAALGYDAFRLLAGGATDAVVTPQSMARFLVGIEAFDGAAGFVSFGPGGGNTRVPLYYIRNREIAPAAR